MIDFNEQRVSGDEAKADAAAPKNDAAPTCGGEFKGSDDAGACACDGGGFRTSADRGFATSTEPARAEPTVTEGIDAAGRKALWEGLVRSQQPNAADALRPAAVAQNPMQWTLVDLTASACDKPGCDPIACDSDECDDAADYDRAEYEISEYALAGRPGDETFIQDEAREFVLQEGTAPAPAAFVETAPVAERKKTSKTRAVAKKAVKKATVAVAAEAGAAPAEAPAVAKAKRAAAKKPAAKKAKALGGKKAAATTAKKREKKVAAGAAAKRVAKKPAAARARKAIAGKLTQPKPTDGPTFPRAEAA